MKRILVCIAVLTAVLFCASTIDAKTFRLKKVEPAERAGPPSVSIEGREFQELQGPRVGMGNPAASFCIEHCGVFEVRKDETGGEVGYCVFPSYRRECEAWPFVAFWERCIEDWERCLDDPEELGDCRNFGRSLLEHIKDCDPDFARQGEGIDDADAPGTRDDPAQQEYGIDYRRDRGMYADPLVDPTVGRTDGMTEEEAEAAAERCKKGGWTPCDPNDENDCFDDSRCQEEVVPEIPVSTSTDEESGSSFQISVRNDGKVVGEDMATGEKCSGDLSDDGMSLENMKCTDKATEQKFNDHIENKKEEAEEGQNQQGGEGQQQGEQSGGRLDQGGNQQEGGEQAGGEQAGGEQAGGEQAGGEQAGGEQAGGEQAGGEQAGGQQGETPSGGGADDAVDEDIAPEADEGADDDDEGEAEDDEDEGLWGGGGGCGRGGCPTFLKGNMAAFLSDMMDSIRNGRPITYVSEYYEVLPPYGIDDREARGAVPDAAARPDVRGESPGLLMRLRILFDDLMGEGGMRQQRVNPTP